MGRALAFVCLLYGVTAWAADQHPGYGVVQSVMPVVKTQPSASAGGSAPSRGGGAIGYMVRVRLDDGTIQFRVLKKRQFSPGDRVLLTNAGDVVPE